MDKKLINFIISIQILILILIFLIFSMSAIPRWDLLDQVSIADRIYMGIEPYPSPNASSLWGVSVYFPGVALLSTVIMQIIPTEFVVETLLALASLITIFIILLQRHIVYLFYEGYDASNFWPLMLIIVLTICYPWLRYALEFKPDSLAYLIGAACILTHVKYNTSLFCSFGLGVIVGCALILKQQHFAFVVGFLSYCLFYRTKKNIVFSLGIIMGTMLVISIVLTNENVAFWTVNVLADDGYLSITNWLRGHSKFALVLVFSFMFLFFLWKSGNLHFDRMKLLDPAKNLIGNPFTWIIFFMFLSAFLGSLKNGGNSGNTAFGVFLLSPLALILFENANRKILVAAATLILFLQFPSWPKFKDKLEQVYSFKYQVESVLKGDCSNLVVGSNVYYSVRSVVRGCDYKNYWTYALKNNTALSDELPKLISDENNRVFVLDNLPETRGIILSRRDINITFQNSIGFIALRE